MTKTLARIAVLSLAVPAAAQGRTDYFNVETPQVKPIALARIAGHDYLLACNTPDNSVEIYDTDESIQPPAARFLVRVPVGLEPASVVFDPTRGSFYTADFLSDSVTKVDLAAPSGPASLVFAVDRTVNVGDEPVDLALAPDGSTLLVTFMSRHAYGAFDADLLAKVAASGVHPAPTDRIDLLAPGGQLAIKEPRNAVVSGGAMFVIGHKGGNEPGVYDLDIHAKDLATGATWAIGGLGSTNAGLAFDGDGNAWVCGGFARNRELLTEPTVALAETGFVESRVWRIARPGQPSAAVTSRDLNEHIDPITQQLAPVAKSDALAGPTDIVAADIGGVTKLFIAAMSSDRVGVLTPTGGAPETWPLERIDIPFLTASTGASGPRALAFKQRSPGKPARLYALNRIDQSIAVIDPAAEQYLESIPLRRDPQPSYLREGRRFLYSAKLSASGFVSCASCHTDARTDALVWDLGLPPQATGPAFSLLFADGPVSATMANLNDFVANGFHVDKGLMVTQSLQGLLNFEMPQAMQRDFSNGPYHWRGDRPTFVDFDQGFAGLLLGSIQPTEMVQFEAFINSVHYPPNPNQPQSRVYSGSFGTPNQNDGGGAQRGLKLFHTQRLSITSNRSCLQCHALPEGSNNRFTVHVAGGGKRAQVESAALRGLLQKDARLDKGPTSSSSVVIGTEAFAHPGDVETLNRFVDIFAGEFTAAELTDVKAFLWELDTGTAPIVGQVETVLPPGSAADTARIHAFEDQVFAANAGLAVRLWTQGATQPRGFRFDPIQNRYVEEGAGTGGAVLTRDALLALVTGALDRAIFASAPLGSDRRLADPDGAADPLPPTTPASLSFPRMQPNTANLSVPLLSKNWIPGTAPDSFDWQHAQGLPTPLSLHAIRLMQLGLAQSGVDYGVSGMRHDPPRRFRVTGAGIQPGALLWIHTPDDPSAPQPDPNGPLNQMATRAVALPIFATGDRDNESPATVIWETAAELDQLAYYTLMVGGDWAPGVQAALGDWFATIPESTTSTAFDPNAYNWHFVQVQNPGQAPVDLGWRQIKIRG